jgi:putative oxidoreductase
MTDTTMTDATMTGVPLTAPGATSHNAAHVLTPERLQMLERAGILYARIALGAAFLSAVADRFGLWGKYGGWGNFANFTKYTAEVNSFMPALAIPFLAWAATVAETSIGIGLILGLWPRRMALGAALLLALFGMAMAISFGVKSPMDYSVFSASAGALLLALCQNRKSGAKS